MKGISAGKSNDSRTYTPCAVSWAGLMMAERDGAHARYREMWSFFAVS